MQTKGYYRYRPNSGNPGYAGWEEPLTRYRLEL